MSRQNISRQKSYKQQRREQALRRRRNMTFIISGVVVLAVIAVIVLILQNNRPVAADSYVTVDKKDWPMADGKAMGPANAPVVVKEFADFQCPYCRQFDQVIQPQLVSQYVTTGKVRLEYHHFIIIDQNVGGTESQHAALASECASEQGQFWNYHEMLFANQQSEGSGAFSDQRLKAFAGALGLDTAKFNTCFSSQRYIGNVNADNAQAISLKVQGTPSLFVNGQLVQNPLDYNAVQTAINNALNGK